jgi:hypothetical protein
MEYVTSSATTTLAPAYYNCLAVSNALLLSAIVVSSTLLLCLLASKDPSCSSSGNIVPTNRRYCLALRVRSFDNMNSRPQNRGRRQVNLNIHIFCCYFSFSQPIIRI